MTQGVVSRRKAHPSSLIPSPLVMRSQAFRECTTPEMWLPSVWPRNINILGGNFFFFFFFSILRPTQPPVAAMQTLYYPLCMEPGSQIFWVVRVLLGFPDPLYVHGTQRTQCTAHCISFSFYCSVLPQESCCDHESCCLLCQIGAIQYFLQVRYQPSSTISLPCLLP